MKTKIITIAIITSTVSFAVCHAKERGIKWIEIQGGTFTMGRGNSARQVTLISFYMSATEVTFHQYDTYCEATGAKKPDDNSWERGNRPVINVSWSDAIDCCQWLSKETGSEVRLPNEAEWEYAAEGGSKRKGYFYSGSDNLKEVSWSEGNCGHRSHPVGEKKPNELGLYDMSGNVWQWCADWPVRDANKIGNNIRSAVRGDSNGNPKAIQDNLAYALKGTLATTTLAFVLLRQNR